MTDKALSGLSPLFDQIHASAGRPSIPPEYLLRALLIQVLYAIPSERKLCEHLEYHLLFLWFVGLDLNEPVWHPTTFTQNRERLLAGEEAETFFCEVKKQARPANSFPGNTSAWTALWWKRPPPSRAFGPKKRQARIKTGGRVARTRMSRTKPCPVRPAESRP